MLRTVREFTYIQSNEAFISLNLEYVRATKGPILWNNNGMYGLIPYARILNAYQDCQVSDRSAFHTFFWGDTVEIDNTTACLLLENVDGKSDDSRDSDTPRH